MLIPANAASTASGLCLLPSANCCVKLFGRSPCWDRLQHRRLLRSVSEVAEMSFAGGKKMFFAFALEDQRHFVIVLQKEQIDCSDGRQALLFR